MLRTTSKSAVAIGMILLLSGVSARGAILQTTSFDATTRTAYAVSNSDLLSTVTPVTTDYVPLNSTNHVITNINDGGNSNATSSILQHNDVTPRAYSVSFDLDLSSATRGYDLSEIQLFSNGTDKRVNQNVSIYYSEVGSPDFHLLTGVVQNPLQNDDYGLFTLRTVLTEDASGVLATGVDALRFDVSDPTNHYTGSIYAEFDVFGTASLPPVPEPTSCLIWLIASCALFVWRRVR